MKKFIPVYQPDISGNEKKYVLKCLDSNWISSKGEYIEKFERSFADFLGVKYATSVCNGTVALHIALLALGVGKNDEVIVPTFTYIASVNAIKYVGAKPIFVDSNIDTWQMNANDIEAKINKKTKAIMAVHLYGQPCDMKKIKSIAKKYNLYLIEDCAEAIGSEYNNKKVGTFGDISTFSFFGNKTITTGEGGMVVSNNKKLYDLSRHFKGQGLVEGREYWHDVVGYNYRMTNICAAIGLAQLQRINKTIKRKINISERYKASFEKYKIPVVVHRQAAGTFNTYWMVSILVNDKKDKEPLRDHLRHSGVETRPLFFPAHTMPMYYERKKYPVAEELSSRGMNLPSWPGLSNDDVESIVSKIGDYYGIKCS